MDKIGFVDSPQNGEEATVEIHSMHVLGIFKMKYDLLNMW